MDPFRMKGISFKSLFIQNEFVFKEEQKIRVILNIFERISKYFENVKDLHKYDRKYH